MMRSTQRGHFFATLLGLTLLAGCGPSPNAPGVGGVTKAQAEELNQAAESLDERANEAQLGDTRR